MLLPRASPVWGLTQVVRQALEQRRNVRPGSESEKLGAQHTAAARVAESRLQASDCARRTDFDWQIVFSNSHGVLPSTGDIQS